MAGMFDVKKPGKGVTKEQIEGRKGFGLFMDIFFRRFWKLILLNILYMVASIPALYISLKISQSTLIKLMIDMGISASEENIGFAIQLTPFFMLFMVQFCGTGPATAGFNYVLKKFVSDTHAWVWSDFVKGFKENWKQALGMYLINTVFLVACIGSMMFYGLIMTEMKMLCFVIAAVLIVFLMMQMYTYQLMVGFKLTLKQIYKNAFILLVLKLPSNIGAMIVSLFLLYLLYNLIIAVPAAVYLMAFVVVMAVLFSVITLAQLFMTKKTVQKYMIDHFENEEDKKSEGADEKDDEFE